MLYTKSKWIFCRKLGIYVNRLTLKVSCLAFKCSFHRQENNAKGGPYRIESWRSENAIWNNIEMKYTNIPTNEAQRLDEWYGVICLVIPLTSRVMVIKTSKMETSENQKLSNIFRGYEKGT